MGYAAAGLSIYTRTDDGNVLRFSPNLTMMLLEHSQLTPAAERLGLRARDRLAKIHDKSHKQQL